MGAEMLSRKELYFLILFFFLGQSYGQEILTEFFKTELKEGKYPTVCDFSIYFTDKKIMGNSKVKCSRIKKPMTIEHVHETKSMHILKLTLKISRNGKTLIKDSNVETIPCALGYSSICKSSVSNLEKTAICPKADMVG